MTEPTPISRPATNGTPQWKPGDLVNGHVLTRDGTWVLVAGAPATPATAAQLAEKFSLAPTTSIITGLLGLLLAAGPPTWAIISAFLGSLALVFGVRGLKPGRNKTHQFMSVIGIVCGLFTLVVWTAVLIISIA